MGTENDGSQRDIESAVGIEQHGILSVELHSLLVGEEHGNARAVFAVVENLFGFVTTGIEVDFGLAEDRALAGCGIVAIDGGGRDETGEGVEGLFVLAFAAETYGGADAGQVDVAQERALQVVDADFGASVLQVSQEKRIVHDVGELELVGALRDERLPVGALGMAGVDGDQAAAGSVEVGAGTRRRGRRCR